ncbi:MAG: zinc ribbon domain-containing protein [Candidatus Hermodarchaeota archaeon]
MDPFRFFYLKRRALLNKLLGLYSNNLCENSQTCAYCGQRRVANQVHRSLYVCQQCGFCLNADVNDVLHIFYHVASDAASQLESSGRVSRSVRVRIIPIRGLPKLRLVRV